MGLKRKLKLLVLIVVGVPRGSQKLFGGRYSGLIAKWDLNFGQTCSMIGKRGRSCMITNRKSTISLERSCNKIRYLIDHI